MYFEEMDLSLFRFLTSDYNVDATFFDYGFHNMIFFIEIRKNEDPFYFQLNQGDSKLNN